jgi:hypothetical protein
LAHCVGASYADAPEGTMLVLTSALLDAAKFEKAVGAGIFGLRQTGTCQGCSMPVSALPRLRRRGANLQNQEKLVCNFHICKK